MLSMEEKERFINTIEDVNNDKTIMTEWMLEENARLKHAGEMSYAKEEGREQGAEENKKEVIINMLNKGYTYNDISDITGKTIEEIKEIESNM